MGYKIAVVGDQNTVTGFALAGAMFAHVHLTKEETLAKLGEFFANDEIGLVLVTHRVVDELGSEYSRMIQDKGLTPLILRIPDKSGHVPKVDRLREVIKRTVGAEIVLKEGE